MLLSAERSCAPTGYELQAGLREQQVALQTVLQLLPTLASSSVRAETGGRKGRKEEVVAVVVEVEEDKPLSPKTTSPRLISHRNHKYSKPIQ